MNYGLKTARNPSVCAASTLISRSVSYILYTGDVRRAQRAQEVLAELDFFKKLHYDLQVDVIRACGFTSTPANSALFRQGDPVSLVYILLRGSVSVHTLGEKL